MLNAFRSLDLRLEDKMRRLISGLCAVLLTAGTFGVVETPSAAPLIIQPPLETTTAPVANGEKVHYRRYYHRHWNRGRHLGWNRRYYRGRYYRRPYYRPYRPYYYRPYYDPYYGDPYYYRRRSGVYLEFNLR